MPTYFLVYGIIYLYTILYKHKMSMEIGNTDAAWLSRCNGGGQAARTDSGDPCHGHAAGAVESCLPAERRPPPAAEKGKKSQARLHEYQEEGRPPMGSYGQLTMIILTIFCL